MKYNRKIIYVMVVISALFLSLAVYLTYFELFSADKVIKNDYNRRTWDEENNVLRGSMTDRSGMVLAESVVGEDGQQKRVYPFGSRYTHVIGYNSRTYGRTALESSYNDMLLADNTIDTLTEAITGSGGKVKGANLRLTLDNEMTAIAEASMQGKSGAVVALVPATGEVLCMYSNPTFDPNEEALAASWAELAEREDSPFVARATGGLYAPGSTFKTITAAAAVAAGDESYTVDDKGSCNIDGYSVSNYGGHAYGQLDMTKGFAKSSNVFFAMLAVTLGESRMREAAAAFGIGETIPFDIKCSVSTMNYAGQMTDTELAAVGIGQGKLMVTPLHMALAAAGIANGGVIMKPYLVDSASYDSGKTIYRAKPEVWKTAVTYETALKLNGFMTECVRTGTGKGARVSGITVAGKTGTAQNERDGLEHAWFICYAPAESPEIAICVMQEYSGATGSSCAPIAKKLIQYYLG